MSKFIRDNQLDNFSKEDEVVVRPIRKKKVKKFKDLEDSKNKNIKKD